MSSQDRRGCPSCGGLPWSHVTNGRRLCAGPQGCGAIYRPAQASRWHPRAELGHLGTEAALSAFDACSGCGIVDYEPQADGRRRCLRCGREWVALHGHVCPGYGRPAHDANDLTGDHRVPLSLGGHSNRTNVAILCRQCNSAKGADVGGGGGSLALAVR